MVTRMVLPSKGEALQIRNSLEVSIPIADLTIAKGQLTRKTAGKQQHSNRPMGEQMPPVLPRQLTHSQATRDQGRIVTKLLQAMVKLMAQVKAVVSDLAGGPHKMTVFVYEPVVIPLRPVPMVRGQLPILEMFLLLLLRQRHHPRL